MEPNKVERNPTGDEALSQVLQPSFDQLQQQLERFAENAQKILEALFKERFSSLDSEQIIVNFLQKELLREQNVNLEQAGHQAEEDISLSKVFVDLPVSKEYATDPPDEDALPESLPSGLISELVTAAQEPLDPQSLQIMKKLVQPGEKLDKYHKLGKYVLIGGPGQGKTTIGQLACQLFRANVLRQKQRLPYKVTLALRETEALCKDEKIPLPQIPRIPFRIVLSDFAERLATHDNKINSVLSYITARIRERTDQAMEASDLRHWLGEYPWFLVFDGLDEVPASSNRDEVIRAIDDFWVDANGVNADILVIATTRPQGYNKDFSPSVYQHKYLVPLSNARALHYGNRLVNIRYKNDVDRQNKIRGRLKLALQEDTTSRLMRSPLQITIMTSLLGRIGTPPQERWSLFSQYYSVIYQRETERNIPASRLLRQFEPDINAIHHRVGLLLQLESEHPERTASKLSLERFTELVEMRLCEEGHEGEVLSNLKKEIIDAAMNRLVFLVGVEAGEIGFEIRSLQEFMAAEALMDGGDEIVKERLEAIAPISHWRNVFLFAVGKCFTQKQYLRDTVYTICASLNESKSSGHDIIEATNTGSHLALDLLEDGVSLRQPKYTKLLTRLAIQALELPPSKIHLRLSNIYNSESYAIFEEELKQFLSMPYPQNLGAWVVISGLADTPVADELIDQFWPHEPENQLHLLDAIVDESNIHWFVQRLNDTILFASLEDATSRSYQQYLRYSDSLSFPWNMLSRMGRGYSSLSISIQLPETQTALGWRFNLVSVKTHPNERLINWGYSAGCHRDWLPFLAASRFLSNPTKETLSHELKQLASQIYLPLDKYLYHNNLPWPLLAALATARSEQELLNYATMIEQGEFGDLDDWSEAEGRWTSQGITLDDFHYLINDYWPYNRQIAKIGFPYVCNSISIHNIDDDIGQNLRDIYKVFDSLLEDIRRTKFHQLLSEWIHLLIAISCINLKGVKYFEKKDLINLAEYEGKTDWKPLNVVYAYWNLSQGSDFVNFVDKIGRQAKTFHYYYGREYDYQEIFDVLSKVFVANPDRLGVLFVLANLCSYRGLHIQIPVKLLNANLAEAKYSVAQLILRLVQGKSSVTILESMALELVNLSEERPESIDEVLRTIRQHKMIDNDTQHFLLSLYAELKHRKNHTGFQSVIGAIENIISQKRSNLVNSWSKLDLPDKLNELITV